MRIKLKDVRSVEQIPLQGVKWNTLLLRLCLQKLSRAYTKSTFQRSPPVLQLRGTRASPALSPSQKAELEAKYISLDSGLCQRGDPWLLSGSRLAFGWSWDTAASRAALPFPRSSSLLTTKPAATLPLPRQVRDLGGWQQSAAINHSLTSSGWGLYAGITPNNCWRLHETQCISLVSLPTVPS